MHVLKKFHIKWDFLSNFLFMIGLMFPITDPLKHIHSALVLTPFQFVVQDWTYFERIMLQY